MMKRLIATVLLVPFLHASALAADIYNSDAVRQTVTVMEAGRSFEQGIDPGEHADVCPNGCIVSFPDGGQLALSGIESVEIRDGAGHLD